MKVAAANAIAKLAKRMYQMKLLLPWEEKDLTMEKDYIIPSTFDPRLISIIPTAVAKASNRKWSCTKKNRKFEIYQEELKQRLDPTVTIMQGINNYIKKNQKKLFADGEDENALKAAIAFKIQN